MKVLLAERDKKFRAELERRLQAMGGVSVATLACDLSEAYHAAEHRSHTVALISSNLARLPEFELLMHLFRAVKTRVVVIFRGGLNPGSLPPVLRNADVTLVPATLADTALHAALSDPSASARRQVRRPRK